MLSQYKRYKLFVHNLFNTAAASVLNASIVQCYGAHGFEISACTIEFAHSKSSAFTLLSKLRLNMQIWAHMAQCIASCATRTCFKSVIARTFTMFISNNEQIEANAVLSLTKIKKIEVQVCFESCMNIIWVKIMALSLIERKHKWTRSSLV